MVGRKPSEERSLCLAMPLSSAFALRPSAYLFLFSCWSEPDITAAYSRLGLPTNLTNERLRVLPKREKLKVERR